MDKQFQDDLNLFLRNNRTAALKFTAIRLRDDDSALDVLQEAMIGFARSARDYEADAWKNLLYKILLRRITDYQRKQGWRNRIVRIMNFSQLSQTEGEEDGNAPVEVADTDDSGSDHDLDELAQAFEVALERLPARQQEAYLLRQWQNMSVAETAKIMGCSEGSVKTHLSRAFLALRKELGDWIDG